MIIKSLSGKTIFKTTHRTMKATLEQAATDRADLTRADFRSAKLSHASLDGLQAEGASFWGADLRGADVGMANLQDCDLRCTDLSDVCFAESNLSRADCRGAYFSRTLMEQTVLDGMKISCPSFWECDLRTVKSMKSMLYMHLGETELSLSRPPILIRGLGHNLVLFEDKCLWDNRLLEHSRNATDPIPKIAGPCRGA